MCRTMARSQTTYFNRSSWRFEGKPAAHSVWLLLFGACWFHWWHFCNDLISDKTSYFFGSRLTTSVQQRQPPRNNRRLKMTMTKNWWIYDMYQHFSISSAAMSSSIKGALEASTCPLSSCGRSFFAVTGGKSLEHAWPLWYVDSCMCIYTMQTGAHVHPHIAMVTSHMRNHPRQPSNF